MARNIYLEVTAEIILDVAQRLFWEKGYDNTTIQDIAYELGGLTNALGDKLFFDNNPFTAVKKRNDLQTKYSKEPLERIPPSRQDRYALVEEMMKKTRGIFQKMMEEDKNKCL